MLCVIFFCCYVKTMLGLERLLTTNARTIILGIYPKGGLSTLRSSSKIEMIFIKSEDKNLFI